jgi:hypothetical protein
MLIKRLDQSSVTINLRNGSKETNDLIQILKVFHRCLLFSRQFDFITLFIYIALFSFSSQTLIRAQEIENRLINYKPNENDTDEEEMNETPPRDEFEVEIINLESAKAFRSYGGIQVKKDAFEYKQKEMLSYSAPLRLAEFRRFFPGFSVL